VQAIHLPLHRLYVELLLQLIEQLLQQLLTVNSVKHLHRHCQLVRLRLEMLLLLL
jgi:hypothetical protein